MMLYRSALSCFRGVTKATQFRYFTSSQNIQDPKYLCCDPRFSSLTKGLYLSPRSNIVFLHTSVLLNKDKGKHKKTKKQEVLIRPQDAEEFIDLQFVQNEMLEVIEKLKHDFIHQFRIGADIKLLDNVKVLLQGDEFQLREVATITKKSSKLLELDFVNFPEALTSAKIAIETSGMNLNPKVKGTKLEVPIPVVTAEHRKTLVKAAKIRVNEAKDATRKLQKYHEKKLSKVEHMPENTGIVIKKQIHIYVDANLKDAETIFKAKEKDLLLQ